MALVMALGLLVQAPGCIGKEQREVIEAREAYYQCVQQGPGFETRCAELEAISLERSERYERNARNRWACQASTQDLCEPHSTRPGP